MKIVIIGGNGLIGSKLVTKVGEHGHEAVAASHNSGDDTGHPHRGNGRVLLLRAGTVPVVPRSAEGEPGHAPWIR